MHNQKQSLKTFHPCKYKNRHTPCNAHTHTQPMDLASLFYGTKPTITLIFVCLFGCFLIVNTFIYIYLQIHVFQKKKKKSKTEGLRNLKTQNFIVMN